MMIRLNTLLGIIKHGHATKLPQNLRLSNLCGQRNLSCSSWYLTANNADNISKTKSKPPSNWGSRKQHRKVKLNFPIDASDPTLVRALEPLRTSVKEQVWSI